MTGRQAQRVLICLFALTATLPAVAQFSYSTHSTRSGAMGGVFIPNYEQRSIAVNYCQGYLLAGMADKSLQVAWPTAQAGSVTAYYLHHGDLDYHEQQFNAGYTLRVARWLHVAVTARYLHLGTSDGHYPTQQWLGASAMLHAHFDATQVTLTACSRPWDSQHRLGLHLTVAYQPSSQLLTVMEIEREDRTRIRMGMEYSYEQRWFVRAGMVTHPHLMTATFGIGLKPDNYAIDLGVEVHSTLGITPQTSLILWF